MSSPTGFGNESGHDGSLILGTDSVETTSVELDVESSDLAIPSLRVGACPLLGKFALLGSGHCPPALMMSRSVRHGYQALQEDLRPEVTPLQSRVLAPPRHAPMIPQY